MKLAKMKFYLLMKIWDSVYIWVFSQGGQKKSNKQLVGGFVRWLPSKLAAAQSKWLCGWPAAVSDSLALVEIAKPTSKGI